MTSPALGDVTRPPPTPRHREPEPMRLIALFKLVKAALILAIGVALLAGVDRREWMRDALDHLRSPLLHKWAIEGIEKLSGLPHGARLALDLGTFLYAAIFATEGVGLWRGKHWAEWLTVVTTA